MVLLLNIMPGFWFAFAFGLSLLIYFAFWLYKDHKKKDDIFPEEIFNIFSREEVFLKNRLTLKSKSSSTEKIQANFLNFDYFFNDSDSQFAFFIGAAATGKTCSIINYFVNSVTLEKFTQKLQIIDAKKQNLTEFLEKSHQNTENTFLIIDSFTAYLSQESKLSEIFEQLKKFPKVLLVAELSIFNKFLKDQTIIKQAELIEIQEASVFELNNYFSIKYEHNQEQIEAAQQKFELFKADFPPFILLNHLDFLEHWRKDTQTNLESIQQIFTKIDEKFGILAVLEAIAYEIEKNIQKNRQSYVNHDVFENICTQYKISPNIFQTIEPKIILSNKKEQFYIHKFIQKYLVANFLVKYDLLIPENSKCEILEHFYTDLLLQKNTNQLLESTIPQLNELKNAFYYTKSNLNSVHPVPTRLEGIDYDTVIEIQALILNRVKNNEIFNAIIAIPFLSQLSLTHSKELDFKAISKFKRLTELDLSYCELESIDFLSELNNLKKLNLSVNHLIDLNDIFELKNLETLDIRNNPELENIYALFDLPKLKILKVDQNNNFQEQLDDLSEKNPNLQIINQ